MGSPEVRATGSMQQLVLVVDYVTQHLDRLDEPKRADSSQPEHPYALGYGNGW